nr:VanZ family protein [Parendozoicomonas sp. Alg238-R29]
MLNNNNQPNKTAFPHNLYPTKETYQRFARFCLPVTLIVITTLALIPPEQVPLATLGDKILHVAAFFTLAGIIDAAWPDTQWNWKKTVWLTSYGLGLEIAQSFHPLRTFALDDLIADIVGQGVYVVLVPALKYLPILRLRWDQ